MEQPLALHLAFVSFVLLLSSRGGATPLPFNISSEGSAEGEIVGLTPTWYAAQNPADMPPTNDLSGSMHMEPSTLSQLARFLQDNLLIIITLSSLVVIVIFLLCCAAIVSQRRKASSYYPSSFPAQKYVDERDRSGGPRTFSEVPDRQPNSQGSEPMDSAKQLQADIKKAAKNLRSPGKTPVAEVTGKSPEAELSEVKEHPEGPTTKMVEEEGHTKSPVHETSGLQNEKSCPAETQDCLVDVKNAESIKEDGLRQEAEQDEALSGTQFPGVHQEEKSREAQEVEIPASQMITEETAAF